MAEPLKYVPAEPAKAEPSARDELELLLEALHRSGTLRTLRGLSGRFPQVVDAVLERLDTEAGKNALGNAAIALTALTKLDSERVDRVVRALTKGLRAADASTREHAPSFAALAALAMREETRRGLYAVLTLLRTVGAELAEHDGKKEALASAHA